RPVPGKARVPPQAIAETVVRHVGEAVAVVVADDPYRAADGAEAVRVTWEPRPAAASVERATAPGAPRVFDDWADNVAGVATSAVGDVARGFAEADVVVEAALDFPRVAGVPIEPRGVVAHPATADGLFTLWSSTQVPYSVRGAVIGLNTINHLAGPYRIPHFAGECVNVVTHKTFMGAYRGAGRPEAAFVLDRLLDRAARRLGLDAADLRRRNLIRKEAMPYKPGHRYRDGVAIAYDPADYVAAFDRALALADYERWRGERDRRRGSARPVGVGLSAYLEGTGIGPFEGADLRIDPGGTVFVAVGVS